MDEGAPCSIRALENILKGMRVGILGTGSYLPESIVDNTEIASRTHVDREWILEKTGISERRYAGPDQATSDLATLAGRQALASAGIDASELDVIILASGTVDQPSPATACFVQANLGADRAIAFDVMAVCAGFLYGVSLAHDMLTADPARKYALIIGAEAYSRFLNYEERGISSILGDGAGAVVVGRTDTGGILATQLGSDGTLAHLGGIAAGGSRRPATAETLAAGQHYVTMQGRQIRELVAGMLPDVVSGLIDPIGAKLSDVDLVVPHQANGNMLQEWVDILDLDPRATHETVGKYGNTGAASIPVTLDDAVQAGRISRGDRVLFLSFGAGVAWAGALVEWSL